MNEWLNDWLNEWMNEWLHEWMNDWMNEWMNDLMNECYPQQGRALNLHSPSHLLISSKTTCSVIMPKTRFAMTPVYLVHKTLQNICHQRQWDDVSLHVQNFMVHAFSFRNKTKSSPRRRHVPSTKLLTTESHIDELTTREVFVKFQVRIQNFK